MAINISTITVDASKQKVWDCLTKPERVKRWQYGSELLTDRKIGSPIEFLTEWQEKVFKQGGTVLDVKPVGTLKYRPFAPRPGLEDKPENYFIMNYVLTDMDGKTKIEIIQEDNRPNAVQEDPQSDENPVLQALKSTAESH